MSEEERKARGQRAMQEYGEVEAAFAQVEDDLLAELAATPIGADPKILKLHMAVQNLAAVKHALRNVIDDGQMASAAIAVAGLTRPN